MFCILDLEVNNVPYLGGIASPFCPDNYIVAPAYALNEGDVVHFYFTSQEEANASDWLEGALATATVLVAHNATFEIHWLLHRHKDVFMSFLKRGGRIFCTQYAEYLLTHQVEQYPSLEETAIKYGGSKKIDEVKLLWNNGVLTKDIDRELLIRYLAGPEGDIVNTRLSCFNQYALLEQQDMLEMFWMRMDGLLFNALATFNGLYVDMEVANRNHAAQLLEAEAIRIKIMELLPKDMPTELEFNFGSGYHMSAFLFGGPAKYDVKVPYDPPKFEKVDCYKVWGVEETYVPVSEVDTTQRFNGETYKAGKNKGQLKVFKVDSDTPKLKWGEAAFIFPGLIDLADLPSHVSDEYLGKRAQFKGKQFLCDGVTPVLSTGKESLDLLANFVGFAKPLKELAQLDKDNGTYYLTTEYSADGTVKKTKGMLQYVGPDGIIHHSLNGCATITSRLSSSNPNLQNLPREGTSVVKEMFSSRFGSEGKIVEVDYSALEVVHLAAASGDQNLRAKLMEGTDMHVYRLAGAANDYMGYSYEGLLEVLNTKTHALYSSIKQARTDIKPKAFQFQYGASAHGISFGTGCSIEEAQQFIDTETALFPDTVKYREVIRAAVEITGALPSGLHREQTDEGTWNIYRRGYFKAPGGTCYSYRQYAKRVNNQMIMDYKDTQLANYWCQGESSLIVQAACGRVIRWLIANDFFGGAVVPINTVHDAIYTDNYNEEWARYAGKYIEHLMATTPAWIAALIPAYKEWSYHDMPFPAVAEFGSNMMNKEHC
jgi:DNA polymerase I-like protein with 3'-5' exonuclease and polymerase domains